MIVAAGAGLGNLISAVVDLFNRILTLLRSLEKLPLQESEQLQRLLEVSLLLVQAQ